MSTPTQDEVKEVLTEKHECCVCEILCLESEGPLFFCSKCFEQTNKEQWFCTSHGHQSHRKKDHQFNDQFRISTSLSVAKVDINKITEGINKLREAVNDFLASGTMKKLEIATQALTSTGGMVTSGVVISNAISSTKETLKAGRDLAHITHTASALGSLTATNAIISGVFFAVESGWLGYQYYIGNITGKELCRRIGKSFIRNGASCIGSTAGMIGGAAVGAFLGPIGAVIGAILGGLIFGTGMSFAAETLYEKCFPNDEQKARQEALDAALKKFQYTHEDLKNKDIFNKSVLNKRFRSRSKEVHPDRPGGCKEKFQLLLIEYGLLLACLENDKKPDVIEMMKQITLG